MNEHKNGALVWVDLERASLGLRSRSSDLLAGEAVLRRTVRRLERAQALEAILVCCPASQTAAVGQLLDGTRAEVAGLGQTVPLSSYVRRRKWSLASWRGGIHDATVFDEQVITTEMVQLAAEHGLTTVVQVPAEAVLIDPALIEAMLAQHHEHENMFRFTFSQAPPGLGPCVYRLDMLAEAAAKSAHIGDVLAYDPATPHADYIINESNYQLDMDVITAEGRCLADTTRSFGALEQALQGVNGQWLDWTAAEAVRQLGLHQDTTDVFCRELEVEITTHPSVRIQGYPHRWEQGRPERAAMHLALFEKIMRDCSAYDDVCVTIGGFGEPLAHPDLAGMVHAAKAAGIFGIHVETDGRGLAGKAADALLSGDVDVVSVHLDADSAALYEQVKGQSGFEQVVEQAEAFIDAAGPDGPVVLPHLVKTRATMAEMETFYDRWLSRCEAAVMVGYNDFSGQIEDKAVMDMQPPRRTVCRRLNRCMTILADGQVVMCGQDFAAKNVVGNVKEQSVSEIWQGPTLSALRQAQREGDFTVNQLCDKCKEWHR